MYKSPIELICQKIKEQADVQIEQAIITETRRIGVIVDKEELIKALNYDRGQYEAGYRDAKSEIVHCKDCKYFNLDHWENIHGIPLIVAHEICTKWSGGCKTKQDGYCFMAERRTDETVQNNS